MSTPTAAAAPTAPVPDCSAALTAWMRAYQKRDADGFFKRRLEQLMVEVTGLLRGAPTDGEPLTWATLEQLPQPAHDFYSDLICASESLADLIADHDPEWVGQRHAALVLIGDALGALRVERFVAMVRACRCWLCREQLALRLADAGEGR